MSNENACLVGMGTDAKKAAAERQSVRASSRASVSSKTSARYRSIRFGHSGIVFAGGNLARLAEQIECGGAFALGVQCDSQIDARPGALIMHAERFEMLEAAACELGGFFNERELEVDLGLIEIAEAGVIAIAILLVNFTSRAKKIERRGVIAAKVMKKGDVVIGLRRQQRHFVPGAKLAHAVIGFQGTFEIVECDQADGHIMQRHADAFHIAMRKELSIRAFVDGQRLPVTTLAMINVGQVDIDACDAPRFIEVSKKFLCAFGRLTGLGVLAQ